MDYEHCQLCDEKTGRAGRADDSIFRDVNTRTVLGGMEWKCGDEIGPLCEQCRDALLQLQVIDE